MIKNLSGIRGIANKNAQLSEAQVLGIREMLDKGEATARELAQVHGVSAETIRRIGRRETWGWLQEGMPPPSPLAETPLPPATAESEAKAQASFARLQDMLAKGDKPKKEFPV